MSTQLQLKVLSAFQSAHDYGYPNHRKNREWEYFRQTSEEDSIRAAVRRGG
jgi:hypothetical protein